MATIQVSEWGLAKLQQHAAAQALNYLSHFGTAGLINMHEFNEMEGWRKLTSDLHDEPFEPMDPDKGKIRDKVKP